jgi:hypothetical protein
MAKEYSDKDCIDYLQEAYNVLGSSPSKSEFNELPGPSAKTIEMRFGSWNEGKREAGLKTTKNEVGEPPEIIDFEQEEWEDMSSPLRTRWRKKEKVIKRKMEVGCEMCGYCEHPDALTFHHENSDKKVDDISTMVVSYGWKDTVEEMKKCKVLCSNCHSIVESEINYQID